MPSSNTAVPCGQPKESDWKDDHHSKTHPEGPRTVRMRGSEIERKRGEQTAKRQHRPNDINAIVSCAQAFRAKFIKLGGPCRWCGTTPPTHDERREKPADEPGNDC